MTTAEFDKQSFGAGDVGRYKGGRYPIATVDFEERLIGLLMLSIGGDPGDITWVRCENVELVVQDVKEETKDSYPPDFSPTKEGRDHALLTDFAEWMKENNYRYNSFSHVWHRGIGDIGTTSAELVTKYLTTKK